MNEKGGLVMATSLQRKAINEKLGTYSVTVLHLASKASDLSMGMASLPRIQETVLLATSERSNGS
jgi:hypothetical protein